MKTTWLLVTFTLFCMCAPVYGQNAALSGRVLNEQDKPEKGLVLIVDKIETTTDSDGKFTVDLRPEPPGSNITVTIKNKPGWAVLEPFMGYTQTQNAQTNSARVSITIAPKRAKQFLDEERLSALIGALHDAGASVELQMQTKSEVNAARELEKKRVLEDYAALSGFDVKEIQSALHQRGKVTAGRETLRKAEEEYLDGNKSRSGFLYRDVGTNETEWEASKGVAEDKHRELINALMRSGTALFEDYNFKEALVSFKILEKRHFESGSLSKETFKAEWLNLKYWMGRAKIQLSAEAKLDDATRLLNEAKNEYEQALNSVGENQFLDSRSKLQYGLGASWLALGKNRFNLKDDVASIKHAIAAFNEAASSIEELKKIGKSPPDLPDVPMAIGEAWYTLGEKATGRESVGYFNNALSAFGTAKKAISPDHDQFSWATLNLNLGRTFLNLADRTADPAKRVTQLKTAVDGFQKANTTFVALFDSGGNSCVSCNARSLINMGIAWGRLERSTNDDTKITEYRKNTLDAFDKADKVINSINQEEEPVTWAGLKAILGQAFFDLAGRTADPTKNAEYLVKAAKAHNEAYALASNGYCSSCAVRSLIELGAVWSVLGGTIRNPDKSIEYFDKASDALDKADKSINRFQPDERLLITADLRVRLGQAFSELGRRTKDPRMSAEFLNKAATSYDEAAALANQDFCSTCAIGLLIGVANAWNDLGQITPSPAKRIDYRGKALHAFDQADKAVNSIKREEEPILWAGAKATLGIAFSDIAARSSDPGRIADYLNKAAIAFESASTVYNGPDVVQDFCSTCAVDSLLDLGDAWKTLGQTVRNPSKSEEYFNKASDAYDRAIRTIARIKNTEDKVIWASMQSDVGQKFSELANRSSDPIKKANHLRKAAEAYENAGLVYDRLDAAQDYCSPCAASTLIDLAYAWETLGQTVRDQSGEYGNKALDAFGKADKAINRIKLDEEPFTWAGLKSRLGDALADLATRTNDQSKFEEYVRKAATAYDEEAKAYPALLANQNYCSPCTTSALVHLGTAWNILGERSGFSDRSLEYLNKAVVTFDKAEKTINRESNTFTWAELNINRGRTFSNLGVRTNEPVKREGYLNSAAGAYEEVSKAHTALFASQDYCSSCAVQSLIDLAYGWSWLAQTTSDSAKNSVYSNKTETVLDKARMAISQIKAETEPRGGCKTFCVNGHR